MEMDPPFPDSAQVAAQVKGRERYEAFVEALGGRVAQGLSLAGEVSVEVEAGTNSDLA